MSKSPQNLRWELRLTLFFVGVLIGLLGGAAVFGLQPKLYQATATIQIKTPHSTGSGTFTLKAEWERIRSREILEPVIKELKLEQKWKADAEPSFRRLRDAVQFREVEHTELVQVSVIDPDPQLAADLANAVVESYRKKRITEEQQQVNAYLMQLEDEVEKQRKKVDLLKSQPEAVKEADEAEKVLKELETQLSTARWQRKMPQAPVTIWERAEVPRTSDSRRWFLTLFTGGIVGLALGAIMAGLVRSKPR